jgi:hypothetical protein
MTSHSGSEFVVSRQLSKVDYAIRRRVLLLTTTTSRDPHSLIPAA